MSNPNTGYDPWNEGRNTGRSLRRTSDWSFLSFELAKRGIPSDVEEIITDDYGSDPWRPPPDTEAITVTLDLAGASKLVGILEDTDDLA